MLVRREQPENALPDAGHAVGNRDTRQAGAKRKRIILDARDAVGDRDIRQAGAALKQAPSIRVTLSGIVMLVRREQPENVPSPMLVTRWGL